MQGTVDMADRAGVQPARPAVATPFAKQHGLQVAQVDGLEPLELQATDLGKCVKVQQLAVALDGAFITAE